jgi:choline dehydrogenase
MGSGIDWNYTSEEEAALDNRRIAWPRGKCLGGSGSLSALLFLRGHRLDYDRWSSLGNSGWSYEEVLPYFRKLEDNDRGASRYRGAGGPMRVSYPREIPRDRLLFIEASRQLGFQGEPEWDFNGAQQEDGAGIYQRNVKDGRRHSSSGAYLAPAMARPNLAVVTGAFATRILWEGDRAAGIEYTGPGGRTEARAGREVILCAGAVETPRLLMLSGIGPADALRTLGIGVKADLPGVGAHLQDHPRAAVRYAARAPIPAAFCTAGLLTRSSRASRSDSPDLQFYLGTRPIDSAELMLTVTLESPRSTGTVALRSANPADPPLIRPNYLGHPDDTAVLVEGIRLVRAIARQRAFDPLRGEELDPGQRATSDGDIGAHLRRTATTIFHAAGTCRMGRGPDAVVNPRLEVNGVRGLRVADASVMPVIVNANTNATCVMIGEKASHLITGDE